MNHEQSHHHHQESERDYDEAYGRLSGALGQTALEYSDTLQDQIINEIWYSDAVVIDTYDAEATLTSKQIIESFEINHAVKTAPHFSEQVGDHTRTNKITSANERDQPSRRMSEYEAIDELNTFFDAAERTDLSVRTFSYDGFEVKKPLRDYAKGLRETMTFIGKKEYDEAVSGIAEYWKNFLDKNPDKQLYFATRWINSHNFKTQGEREVKSDDYILESVLENFSDEELAAYQSQLLLYEDDIVGKEPENVRVVFLDDWMVSGEQLIGAVNLFIKRHPEFVQTTEIQLIAALETRLKNGMVGDKFGVDGSSLGPSLPIRAYYVAHQDRNVGHGQVRITGAHSSVDYNFHDDISFMSLMAEQAVEQGNDDPTVATLATMPVLADIERPYRAPGFELTQRVRLAGL